MIMPEQTNKAATPPFSSRWLQNEFFRNQHNGCVGTKLVSQTGNVRVWLLHLEPGQRIGFHRHVLDYFWTAHGPGVGRSHMQDGSVIEVSYAEGETRHFTYAEGEYKMHDLENIGATRLMFTTVEFLKSANQPLALPKDVMPG
jgi:beta-alanine degradation protein BauB